MKGRGDLLVHFGLQVRSSQCNLKQRKSLKTRENRRVQTGQVGLANRRRLGWLSRIYVSAIGGNRSEQFRRYFAMGKIRGTPYMRSHIFVHRATTKYFSKSFVFKTEIEKEGLPGDITPALGAGGPEFKSRRPDH